MDYSDVPRWCEFFGVAGKWYAVAPEHALLFLSANIYAASDVDKRLRQVLGAPLRWERVTSLAAAHGVSGLLRRRLRDSGCWDQAPASARQALDQWASGARLRHLMIAQQLVSLLEASESAGVRPILLKGAALAATAYPDPTLRSMADLDLLVAKEQRQPMVEVLTGLGYEHQALYYGDDFNAAQGYHYLFYDRTGRLLPIELHWELASRLERRNRLSAALLQARTVSTRVTGMPVRAAREARVLTPEAQLIHLATHAATEGHAFSRLNWLADIAAVAGAPQPPDWPEVWRLASLARARTAAYVALTLARELLGAAVPAELPPELEPPRLIKWAVDRTINPATLLEPLSEVRRGVVKYLVVDSPAMTARLLAERLFPPPAVLRVYYPAATRGGLATAYVKHVASIGAAALHKGGAWSARP